MPDSNTTPSPSLAGQPLPGMLRAEITIIALAALCSVGAIVLALISPGAESRTFWSVIGAQAVILGILTVQVYGDVRRHRTPR